MDTQIFTDFNGDEQIWSFKTNKKVILVFSIQTNVKIWEKNSCKIRRIDAIQSHWLTRGISQNGT